jgi:cell division protein FtsI/penicillin-binding protein 2
MSESAPLQAMAVAVDPHSGAVLAVAARPDFEPARYDQYDPDKLAAFAGHFII